LFGKEIDVIGNPVPNLQSQCSSSDKIKSLKIFIILELPASRNITTPQIPAAPAEFSVLFQYYRQYGPGKIQNPQR